MKPFPSPLPPHTVLDCILDENWQDNGILHVLDVLKWKEQDITECETPFRFWWRDTRLSELPVLPPPANASEVGEGAMAPMQYRFPHPATLLPTPYHTNTSLTHLLNALIPLTRTPRMVMVTKRVVSAPHVTGMDLDMPTSAADLEEVAVHLRSDGLLLYVAQATYEPGTSPLSSWVPLVAYTNPKPEVGVTEPAPESPLNVFERCVPWAPRMARYLCLLCCSLMRRRLAMKESEGPSVIPEVDMEEEL